MLVKSIFLILFLAGIAGAEQLGTAFTYQGHLKQANADANGEFDLEFQLFDIIAGGASITTPILLENVSVMDGIFTLELDFDVAPFAGDRLWLQVGVREGASSDGYTVLLPRQEITPVPYALHAEMVAIGSIGDAEVDSTQVQLRISDSCTPGTYIRAISADGTVACETDAGLITVTGADIQDDTITSADIATAAVGSAEIADYSVFSNDLATNAVWAANIAANQVGASEIADDAVGADEIAAGAVGTAEIADYSVFSNDLATNAVWAPNIAANQVGASEIADDAVGSGEIVAGAVGSDEIADGAVTFDKIDYASTPSTSIDAPPCGTFVVAGICPASNSTAGAGSDCDAVTPGSFCEYDSGCPALDPNLDNCPGGTDWYFRVN